MKLTKIAIENLGPYFGENTFDFTVNDKCRKVVLIGGKNGAGKTTLFNAIRVGLYGCRAYGFESDNAKYIEIIAQMINSSARISPECHAGVTISILMDDGKDDFVYTFERKWRLDLKKIKEEVIVTKNGIELTETELSDFHSYLLQLIPPDMFRFYFFDGESIGNFVFNGIKNTDFKNAFLKLCGLDTMELIMSNFRRISNSKKKDESGAFEHYQLAQNELSKLDDMLDEANQNKDSLKTQMINIEEKLARIEQAFLERGGITKKEYQNYQAQLHREEARRDENRRWLREAANDYLPFVILKKEIEDLRKQILYEDKRRTSDAFIESLKSTQIKEFLCSSLDGDGTENPEDLTERIIALLSSAVDTSGQKPMILNLSQREQLELLAKIQATEEFDTRKVKEKTSEIERSLDRTKRIRAVLEKNDESGAENYLSVKEKLLQEKAQAMEETFAVERVIDALSVQRADLAVKVKQAQQKYEEYLKSKSVYDITAKALLAFGDLQKRLYKKYISDVERNFSECFGKLINKTDLIDGIKIDDQLQVYPYKWKTFAKSELNAMLAEDGGNYLVSQIGSLAYEEYLKIAEDEEAFISLPVEVKQQLSAGEKQIFIMALYQALSTLNKVSVPYIIDTPFARIDAQHRQNILNNFFMGLKGQIIILSTDEEIAGEYKESISASVSDFYLLNHEENNGTQILKSAYFGEEIK